MMAGYEQRERELWRWSLLLLILLAIALGAAAWETLKEFHPRIQLLPLGVVLFVLVLVVLVARKKREVDRLRAAMHALEGAQTTAIARSKDESERLLEVVKRSQTGYRALIDSFDDAVFAISLDGEVLAANRRFTETLDLPFAEVIGHRLDEFLTEPDPAEVSKGIPRFVERRHWAGIVRVRLKASGSVRFFDCVLHAIVRDSQVAGASVLARDITHERESEARFVELFETLQEGIYFTTPDGRFLDANPALVRMLGYPNKEDFLKVSVPELYMDPAERSALMAEINDKGRLRNREITLRRLDGSPILCLDTCSAVRDSLGNILRFQGTLVDITVQREMEKNLHREQEFARRLIESFPDAIVVIDDQGRFTYVSPRIRNVLDYGPEELIGGRIASRASPEDRGTVLDLYEGLITGEQELGHVQYRTQHKDGTWRLVRGNACPIKDSAGHITGVVASFRDVTEVDRLEQQVMQSEKLAAMGQMIAGVAHELNNPLTAILAVSDLLRDRAGDSPDKRQFDLLHQQARRAADIVQDLLSFARPPAPQRGRVKLGEAVRRALHLHEYSLRRNNVSLDLLPEEGLPDVVGDANQLIQVFLNLVINAEQAIREVREQGSIRVRLGCGAGSSPRVWASFQDDGPGIPPEILPKIFDPFFTTKRPGRGTGLGLSICMAIVREHGGDIQVQPAPGGGAVFTVMLPPAPLLDQPAPDTAAVAAPSAAKLSRVN
jgi:two-component system NtrC family sensor kinase